MKTEIKEQFIRALCSGRYQPCKKRLHSKDGTFDALGVLCDLAVRAGVAKWEDFGASFAIDGEAFGLPKRVREWAEVKTSSGQFSFDPEIVEYELSSLAELSDEGFQFSEIASIVAAFGEVL